MGKRILFSPVGGSDPVRNKRDGSMIHICRHYKPDVVYLYLSHEMMEFHRKDNRYIKTIERLGGHLDHSFEVKLIKRDELIDVQEYDRFYQDFREEIKKIEKGMGKEDELLINMASGTPAMKSALMVMATLAEYRFKPIQVSTPQKGLNPPNDETEDCVEKVWKSNKDNEKDAENRCVEVKCYNLMKILKVEEIKKHVEAYDYAAALTVAKEIKEDLSEEAYQILRIADARIKLDQESIDTLMNDKKYDIYPVKEEKKRKIFEYALMLQIKIAKQELGDFVRGITPLVVDLLENIVENECGIKLASCCKEKKEDEVREWDRKKLQRMRLLEMFDSRFRGGFKEGPIYSSHLKAIIDYKCSGDRRLVGNVRDIVKVERVVRNIAAHEIVSVTDKWIKERTGKEMKKGKTAQQILEIIKYLITKAGIDTKELYWNSYDKMNDTIKMYLDM